MNLQDTVAFYGNLSNIITLIGGALVMTLGMLLRRRARVDVLPESVKVELAVRDTVALLHQSAYVTRRAMIAVACEALREQAELEGP
ncbi:hypothetical protein [Amycolatopsis sp. cmx-8-4]|uniref:hypothetical protein n=1 Tax=Amycolatopsis sp. cmx-8-4 TaxID=2790947 RepID=UPI00397A4124